VKSVDIMDEWQICPERSSQGAIEGQALINALPLLHLIFCKNGLMDIPFDSGELSPRRKQHRKRNLSGGLGFLPIIKNEFYAVFCSSRVKPILIVTCQ
jgi:hypothetical protein